MKGSDYRFIVSCEHGGNRVPAGFRELFSGKARLLDSHRGWDPGALQMAKQLEKKLNARLFYMETTRLLIDLNRSLHHPGLFSELSRQLDSEASTKLINEYYRPYRQAIELYIRRHTEQGRIVIHISSHSFTPELNGKVRSTDIGLLYDPARRREKKLCENLRNQIQRAVPGMQVRMNYPYRGTADGLTTFLRKQFNDNRYTGIELEVNQAITLGERKNWYRIQRLLATAVNEVYTRLFS